MRTHSINGAVVIEVSSGDWGSGPYDTHVAWGAIGHTFGELVIAHRGLANTLFLIVDRSRPATPVLPRQLTDIPHVCEILAAA